MHPFVKEKHRLRKTFEINEAQKQAEVSILISDKADFNQN
jgi:hypothetical protein